MKKLEINKKDKIKILNSDEIIEKICENFNGKGINVEDCIFDKKKKYKLKIKF